MLISPKYKTFEFAGLSFPLFAHHHNCGHPPDAMSERSIEMALADVFLATTPRESVVEVGAVTPYYWPYRVKNIADPTDTHPLVNIRANFLDIDCTGKHILSLSTFEHIGAGDYGLPRDPALNIKAFEKLFREAASFLVTVPGGFNPPMDAYLLTLDAKENNISTRALIRVSGNQWEQRTNLSVADLKYQYGSYCLLVISRRSFLDERPTKR